MLSAVKNAIPVRTDAYDGELSELIAAATEDLKAVGILVPDDLGAPLIRRAIITYCKLHFGSPENPELLRESYKEQKGQLQTSSGYTQWDGGETA